MTTQIAYLVPASNRDFANAALEAAGMGPNNFVAGTVPQSHGTREPPATHYACQGWFTPEEAAVFDNVIQDISGARSMEELGGLSAFRLLMDAEEMMRVKEEVVE